MTVDQIEYNKIYECQIGRKVDAVAVQDVIPGPKGGIIGKNLTTGREVFIKTVDVPKRVKSRIDNMSEWRLKHGD